MRTGVIGAKINFRFAGRFRVCFRRRVESVEERRVVRSAVFPFVCSGVRRQIVDERRGRVEFGAVDVFRRVRRFVRRSVVFAVRRFNQRDRSPFAELQRQIERFRQPPINRFRLNQTVDDDVDGAP